MKKLILLATAAAAILGMSSAGQAADLPVRAPAVPMLPPPFSWTGFYLGGNIGGAWAHRNVTDNLFGLNFSQTSDGVFIGGGQVGFNYQMGGFLLGVEADFDWAGNNNNNSNNGVAVPGVVGLIRVSANDKWISTVAARFGMVFGQSLLYGKAGGGWVGADNFTITNLTTGASITGGNSRSNSGFLLGAGYEYAFTNNWTAKIEYDYLGLGSRSFVVPAGAPFLVGDVFTNRNRNIQTVKVGFNYLFNTGGRY
jgi:outer membrane immunogenic protein